MSAKSVSRNQSTVARHACDMLREQLKELHDTYGLSWRKISNMGQYKGIPAGTLCAFANGSKDLPDKFKSRFGIPFELLVQVCSIHGVVHKYDCQTQAVKSRTRKPQYKSLFDWPVNELRAALLNRVDVSK